MLEAHNIPVTSEVLRSEALKSEDNHVLLVSHKIFLLIGTVALITLVLAGVIMHILHCGLFAEFSLNTLAIVLLSILASFSTKNIVLKLQKRRYEFLGGLVNVVLR
jgi:hypothetical protein